METNTVARIVESVYSQETVGTGVRGTGAVVVLFRLVIATSLCLCMVNRRQRPAARVLSLV